MTDHSPKLDSGIAEPEAASLPNAPSPDISAPAVSKEGHTSHSEGQILSSQSVVAGGEATPEAKPVEGLAEVDEKPKDKPAGPSSPDSGFWGLLQSFAITIIIALFIITFVVQAFQIPSQSMENTLLIGDYLLVDKAKFGQSRAWSWLLPYRPIERGDIIVFRYPVNPELHFVKRVVAIPGDRLHLRNGQLYINGALQSEPFTVHKVAFPDSYRDDFPNGEGYRSQVDQQWSRGMPEHLERGELVVPPDAYFAMGDNRDDSLDSRYWGFVPRQNIVGRPLLIYFSHEVSAEPQATGVGDTLVRLVSVIRHFPGSVRWNRALRVIR